MPSDFRCIYCRRRAPYATASTAHVFPEVIGGTFFSKKTVCRACNGRVNREVESKALSAFDFFQSCLGIRGRRGRIRPVKGTVTLEGQDYPVSVGEEGVPTHPV